MNLIEKANQTLKHRKNYRYKYHISPSSGWSNDPNGLVFYQGKYHIFMQNDPFHTKAKKIFWAHFVSRDLVQWQQVAFALAPDHLYDIDGCYSGSAIVSQDKLFLVYAGHRNEKQSYIESICIAESSDGIHFSKRCNNPIIVRDPQINTKRFRDPKIFEKEGKFYIIVGGESINGVGQLLLYQSSSIYGNWQYVGKISNKNKDLGNMLECPDFFSIAGEGIILASPKGMSKSEKHGFDSSYYFGKFRFNNDILPVAKKLDYGWDFYAPQTMYDPINNRRILIGWLGLPVEQDKEQKHGYHSVGALTLPRELIKRNGKLLEKPIAEYHGLHMNTKNKVEQGANYSVSSEFIFQNVPYGFKLRLFSSDANYSIKFDNSTLTVEVTDQLRHHTKSIGDIKEINNLDIYVDNGLTELFINYGEFVFTNKCEFNSETLEVDLDNNDKVVGFNYKMKSIFK